MNGNDRRGVVLQARDLKLLQELDTMRVIDREQAKLVAGFGSTTRANARLLALTEAGLLRRNFIGTVGSGHKAVYSLSPKSAAEIGAKLGALPFKPADHLVGSPFLLHQLEVNRIFLAVKYRSLPVGGIRFIRWLVFREPIVTAFSLIPDGYFELETPAGIRAMFVEVDLGTETNRIWRKKVQMYLQLALSGQFHREFHQSQFRVLVIAPSERRIEGIRSAVSKSTDKIFWFASLESINRDGFWSAVWLRPAPGWRQALL
jgi:hypothetical protein